MAAPVLVSSKVKSMALVVLSILIFSMVIVYFLFDGQSSGLFPNIVIARPRVQYQNEDTDNPTHAANSRKVLVQNSNPIDIPKPKVVPPQDKSDTLYHPLCPKRVARKFPLFSYPHVQPIKWTDHLDVTNGTLTSFAIVNPRLVYRVCDELELRIIARNGRNEDKTYGGDYFRAKIVTKNVTFVASSSTDGEVVDHGNGTYSAYFTLKWSGSVEIIVTLVHSSEAIFVLRKLRDLSQPRQTFLGKFISNGSEASTYCNFQLSKDKLEKEFCNYTDAHTGMSWYCVKPDEFECSDWQYHMVHGGQCNRESFALTNSTERDAFTDAMSNIKVAESVINVTSEDATQDIETSIDSLPPCAIGHHLHQGELAGFYQQNAWQPPTCRPNRFPDIEQKRACFRNRQFFFFGDSTTRQLHEYYLNVLHLKKAIVGNQSNAYTSPTTGSDASRNISTYYAFHYFPIGRMAWTLVTDIDYIEKRIDSIKNVPFPVVIVGFGLHFTFATPEIYEDRILGIFAAVERLLTRNPRALVFFKGLNTRQHPDFNTYACCSDWNARELEARFRSVLWRHERVGFFNVWDMTQASLEDDNAHPTGPFLSSLSDLLLTSIGCPDTQL